MLRFVFILLAIFGLPLLHAAPVFEVLADFQQAGTIPSGRLVSHPDGNFYGCTISGGVYGFGTVFKMQPDGTTTTLVSFTGTGGAARGDSPSDGLAVGADGALYGTTLAGGTWGLGTIFKVTTAGAFTTLVEFKNADPARGSVPNSLLLHADGLFYGTTQSGGASECGTVFKMTASGGLTTIAEFTGMAGNKKGTVPTGRLTADATKVYGTTQYGGAGDLGTVFSITTATNAFATLFEFTGTAGFKRGSGPLGGVLLVGTTLFGTTETGGVDDLGTVFRWNLTGGSQFGVLRDFSGADGSAPAGQLFLASDGLLYGTTSTGGDDDAGVVFRISTSGSYLKLLSFSGGENAPSGANPRSALISGADGALYGTTEGGGPAENGSVFRVTTAGDFTHVAAFTNSQGWKPVAAPLAAANGVIFPLKDGGAKGHGTSLRFPLSGTPVVEHTFGSSVGSPAGGFLPFSGYLYGLSADGVFFQLADGVPPAGVAKLGSAIGEDATDLTASSDGYFFGTSPRGGASGNGAVFRISPSGVKTVVASFNGANGKEPGGPLVDGGDGSFFGTTRKGGAVDFGTVFKVLPDGTISTVVSFSATGPREPMSGLVKSADGNLYGTTSRGGASGDGTVFRISPSSVLTIVAELTGSNGARPGSLPGRLCSALDGTIYGTAEEGGSGDAGAVFRISPAGVFTTLFQFTGKSGAVRGEGANSGLSFGPGGALFGAAPNGGTGGGGTAFRVAGTGPHVSANLPNPSDSTLLLSANAQLGGEATEVVFDYGSTLAFGQVTPLAVVAPSANTQEVVVAQIPKPTAGQTTYFRPRATNASGTSIGQTLSFGPSSQWKLANLGDAYAEDLGDPDSDGVPTIVEYALCMSPSSAGSTPPAQRATFPEGPRLTMNVLRDPMRADVTIEVRGAPSPSGPWSVVATSVNGAAFTGPGYVSGEVGGTAPRTVVIKDSAATNADKTRFMQIRVVH